jgi:phosphatidylinositol glycan class W
MGKQANLPYVLWVAAYNTSFILGYLLLDLFFFPSPLSKSAYSSTSKLKVPVKNHSPLRPQQQQAGNPPALLEAFNENGLALFLLVRWLCGLPLLITPHIYMILKANVATGLVNLMIPTMYASDFWAMVVLSLYGFGVCAVAWALRDRRLLRL